MSVNLEWVGLACFRLWEDGGPVVVTDPYTPSAVGLVDEKELAIRLVGDTVICSSFTDIAHNDYGLVDGSSEVINALDVARGSRNASIGGEPVVAVQAAESPDHPEGPDDNALYAFKVGGLWVLHMGDVGFGLDNEAIAPFKGKCDVLLALTGEALTLRLEDLDPMIDYLEPAWVVPMHYNLAPISGFEPNVMTKLDGFVRRRDRDPVLYARDHTVTLPLPTGGKERPTIVVLEPSGYRPTE
jgi:L-ascorbate metabolism protein UlaG (beta-lactamase superfamily)